MFAIVDESDYESLSRYKWSCNGGYAERNLVKGNKKKGVKGAKELMHRRVINAPVGVEVDHINGCGIDNRRCNLRLATPLQNRVNTGPNRRNTTGFKGVYFDKSRNKYGSQIRWMGIRTVLGRFLTKEEAHEAYKAASLRLHGEFSVFASA